MVAAGHNGRLAERLKLLVTAKTYPQPSATYQETVCTAGIASDGRWIRLYPIQFRYWAPEKQYSLYDWIEVTTRKRPPYKDNRKESYSPLGDVQVVGQASKANNWAERRRLVLPYASPSVEYLQAAYGRDGTSLGLVQPAKVVDVVAEKEQDTWNPRQLGWLTQGRLFGPGVKRLEKLDRRFSYVFRCHEPGCKGHKMKITDWGLCLLYLKIRAQEGEKAAVEKTAEKCQDIVADDKDSYLYVGTVWPKPSFIVIGMFYPKKERSTGQAALPLG